MGESLSRWLDEMVIGRMTMEPGWVWDHDVKPLAGTEACQYYHLGVCLSGGAPRRARAFAWLLTLALTACAVSSGPPSSVGAPATSAAASLTCEEPNLLSPQGNRVDLTGTWSSASTLFYIRQSRECVWWIGLSNWPGQSPGDFFSHTFAGRLGVEGANYVVRGEWASIIRPGSGMGYSPPFERLLAFEVVFETKGGAETIVLREMTPRLLQTTDWYAGNLTRTGPLPDTQTP